MEKNQDNCHASKCCGVMSPHRKKHQTHFSLFIFLFFTASYCKISVRKNVLRILYRRLKAGISVCWLCLFVAVCKSVFLLQIKYIGKFKLFWQLKIWVGGGEVKLYYYAMKGSMGGGGGVLPKQFLKEVERKQRPK